MTMYDKNDCLSRQILNWLKQVIVQQNNALLIKKTSTSF